MASPTPDFGPLYVLGAGEAVVPIRTYGAWRRCSASVLKPSFVAYCASNLTTTSLVFSSTSKREAEAFVARGEFSLSFQ